MSKYGTRSPRVKSQASQGNPIPNQPSEAVLVPEQLIFPGIDPAGLMQASDADSRLISALAGPRKRRQKSIVRNVGPLGRKK